MDKTNYTDEQLVAMIQGGGNARRVALEQIYRSAYCDAKGMILSRGGKSDEVSGATADAIIVLDNHIRNGKYKPIEGVTFKSYFLGICYWQWRSKTGATKRIDLPGDMAIFDRPEFKTPEVLMLEERLKELIRQLLQKEELGDRCRKAVTLWSLSYPLKEIAQIMNTTYGYAQQMVFDCRNKLKKILEKDPVLMRELRELLELLDLL